MATEKKAVQSAQAVLAPESASKEKKVEAAVIPSSIKFLFGGLAGLVELDARTLSLVQQDTEFRMGATLFVQPLYATYSDKFELNAKRNNYPRI